MTRRTVTVDADVWDAYSEFFSDVDAYFTEVDNPLGRNLPLPDALRVSRATGGQIRRWWERARTQLEEAAR